MKLEQQQHKKRKTVRTKIERAKKKRLNNMFLVFGKFGFL